MVRRRGAGCITRHVLGSCLKDPTSKHRSSAYTIAKRSAGLARSVRTEDWRYTEWNGPGAAELLDSTELSNRVDDDNLQEVRTLLQEQLGLAARQAQTQAGRVTEHIRPDVRQAAPGALQVCLTPHRSRARSMTSRYRHLRTKSSPSAPRNHKRIGTGYERLEDRLLLAAVTFDTPSRNSGDGSWVLEQRNGTDVHIGQNYLYYNVNLSSAFPEFSSGRHTLRQS